MLISQRSDKKIVRDTVNCYFKSRRKYKIIGLFTGNQNLLFTSDVLKHLLVIA